MKFVVIDDDPTGSQTVHDCLLLLKWDCSTLVKGFESKSNLFFILANTRSLSGNDAKLTIEQICKNLKTVIASLAYEEEIVFMFNDIMDEIKKIELREKIESLEDKVSLNLDETLYSELLQLRNQLKRG